MLDYSLSLGSVNVMGSNVIHGKINPPFGRRSHPTPTAISTGLTSPKHGDTTHDGFIRTWTRDFPAILQEAPVDDATPCPRRVTLRVILENNLARPFPQSHRIIITCPTEDIFFHWVFECTPFSFKTLVQTLKWDLTPSELEAEFVGFGDTLKKCISQCSAQSDRCSM
jgi:hypothetical protein